MRLLVLLLSLAGWGMVSAEAAIETATETVTETVPETAVAKATLKGRVWFPPGRLTEQQRADVFVVFHHKPPGTPKKYYTTREGHFSVFGLDEGVYLLEVAAVGWKFSAYKVEVSSLFHDKVKVTPVDCRIPLEPEVILIPLSEVEYQPKKKPFSIMKLLMSPYGIMMVLAVFALVVTPHMKVDPEEMAKMQEEMKDSPLSFLMGGQPPQVGQTNQGGGTVAASTPSKKPSAAGKKKR